MIRFSLASHRTQWPSAAFSSDGKQKGKFSPNLSFDGTKVDVLGEKYVLSGKACGHHY